jgi:ribosome-interacting GTPase 1
MPTIDPHLPVLAISAEENKVYLARNVPAWVEQKFPVPSWSSPHESLALVCALVFDMLRIVRVYCKTPGRRADLSEPVILPQRSVVLDFARAIHKDLARQFKYARVWNLEGNGGNRVARDYVLKDGEIVELHT